MIKLTPEYLDKMDEKICFCDITLRKKDLVMHAGGLVPCENIFEPEDHAAFAEAMDSLNEAKKNILYASCAGKRAGSKRLYALIQAYERIDDCYSLFHQRIDQFEEDQRKMEICEAKQHLEDKLRGSSPGSLRFLPEDDHFPWD